MASTGLNEKNKVLFFAFMTGCMWVVPKQLKHRLNSFCRYSLYGIVLVQLFLYLLNYPRDSRLRKGTVIILTHRFNILWLL